jgi:hypothetical protein
LRNGFNHHPVARLEILDALPNFGHYTTALVSHDSAYRNHDSVQVAMDVRPADAAILNFYQDISRFQLGSRFFLKFNL